MPRYRDKALNIILLLLVQFGHALQHLLTTVEYSDINGLSFVEWDAVFVCDYFMENWYETELRVCEF